MFKALGPSNGNQWVDGIDIRGAGRGRSGIRRSAETSEVVDARAIRRPAGKFGYPSSRMPGPVPVTVVVRAADDEEEAEEAREPTSGENRNRSSSKRDRFVAGSVRGIFHPDLYVMAQDCITYNGERIGRSRFERLGNSSMAKWHRSIRVIADDGKLEPLGEWLSRHGLPVIKGKHRVSRKRTPKKPGPRINPLVAAGLYPAAAAADSSSDEDAGSPTTWASTPRLLAPPDGTQPAEQQLLPLHHPHSQAATNGCIDFGVVAAQLQQALTAATQLAAAAATISSTTGSDQADSTPWALRGQPGANEPPSAWHAMSPASTAAAAAAVPAAPGSGAAMTRLSQPCDAKGLVQYNGTSTPTSVPLRPLLPPLPADAAPDAQQGGMAPGPWPLTAGGVPSWATPVASSVPSGPDGTAFVSDLGPALSPRTLEPARPSSHETSKASSCPNQTTFSAPTHIPASAPSPTPKSNGGNTLPTTGTAVTTTATTTTAPPAAALQSQPQPPQQQQPQGQPQSGVPTLTDSMLETFIAIWDDEYGCLDEDVDEMVLRAGGCTGSASGGCSAEAAAGGSGTSATAGSPTAAAHSAGGGVSQLPGNDPLLWHFLRSSDPLGLQEGLAPDAMCVDGPAGRRAGGGSLHGEGGSASSAAAGLGGAGARADAGVAVPPPQQQQSEQRSGALLGRTSEDGGGALAEWWLPEFGGGSNGGADQCGTQAAMGSGSGSGSSGISGTAGAPSHFDTPFATSRATPCPAGAEADGAAAVPGMAPGSLPVASAAPPSSADSPSAPDSSWGPGPAAPADLSSGYWGPSPGGQQHSQGAQHLASLPSMASFNYSSTSSAALPRQRQAMQAGPGGDGPRGVSGPLGVAAGGGGDVSASQDCVTTDPWVSSRQPSLAPSPPASSAADPSDPQVSVCGPPPPSVRSRGPQVARAGMLPGDMHLAGMSSPFPGGPSHLRRAYYRGYPPFYHPYYAPYPPMGPYEMASFRKSYPPSYPRARTAPVPGLPPPPSHAAMHMHPHYLPHPAAMRMSGRMLRGQVGWLEAGMPAGGQAVQPSLDLDPECAGHEGCGSSCDGIGGGVGGSHHAAAMVAGPSYTYGPDDPTHASSTSPRQPRHAIHEASMAPGCPATAAAAAPRPQAASQPPTPPPPQQQAPRQPPPLPSQAMPRYPYMYGSSIGVPTGRPRRCASWYPPPQGGVAPQPGPPGTMPGTTSTADDAWVDASDAMGHTAASCGMETGPLGAPGAYAGW